MPFSPQPLSCAIANNWGRFGACATFCGCDALTVAIRRARTQARGRRKVSLGPMETTLVLIKPGGVKRGLIGEVTRRIEARDLKVVGLKLMNAPRATVEEHYAEHKERPFFKDVCDYLTSGPIVAIAVQGPSAIMAIRTMMGATNPINATPGTIRGDFALTIDDNLTHSSDGPEAAARELALWFPEGTV